MREDARVRAFERGSGKKYQRSRVVGDPKEDSTSIGVHGFVFNFKYSDKPGDGEVVCIFSDDYENAQDEAFEERKDKRTPISVEAIDPPIRDVLETIFTGAKNATKIGGKYAIRAGKAGLGATKDVVRESGRLVAFGVQSKLVESLLRLCYQKDPAKRNAARAALKSRYPEIWRMCDFSPGGYRY